MYFSFSVEISFILIMKEDKITKAPRNEKELWHLIYFIDGMICDKFQRQRKVANNNLTQSSDELSWRWASDSRFMMIVIIIVIHSFSLTWKKQQIDTQDNTTENVKT